MVTIGIGDKDLTKIVAGNQTDNLLYTLGVELVEDIVEQQERRRLRTRPLQEVKLCQLQRNDVGLILSLRTLTFHQVAIEGKLQIVTMDTMQ